MKKVLILGVNGFIGHHLSKRILETTDWDVYGMDMQNDRLGDLVNHPRMHFFEGDITINKEYIEYHVKKCDAVIPLVAIAIPLAAFLIARVQRITDSSFDPVAARASIATDGGAWSTAERRLMVVVVLAMLAWITQPWTEPLLPKGGLTDGTIAAAAGLAMFLLPDGTGRPMLTWPEANRAPWDVVLMFGGGLALAMGMTASGLAEWLGQALLPLASLPPFVLVLVVVAFIIVITEFASNIATASGIMPVVAALAPSMSADPLLIALPAAIAASWGFMLPAGTGPNALAWATGHITLKRMIAAGFWLDVLGALLIVGVIWTMHTVLGYG